MNNNSQGGSNHPATSSNSLNQQKINNFVDVSLNQINTTQNSIQLTNNELQHLKGVKTNQSTDFASPHNQSVSASNPGKQMVHLNSKFQSAPSTPTKSNQGGVRKLIQEEQDIKPQLIERNVITKYAFATRVGFIPNNPNKVNQDSFILSPNLNGCNFRHYFGVCDGHGQNGKEASHFIKMRLPQMIGKNIDEALSAQQ
jgi:hypothetical protein